MSSRTVIANRPSLFFAAQIDEFRLDFFVCPANLD